MSWIASALQEAGFRVERHEGLECCTHLPVYANQPHVDLVVYNHTDVEKVHGMFPITSDMTWFFKPTVPDEDHATLDRLGFGPFSEITYTKPDYLSVKTEDVENFYNTQVREWVESKSSKWGLKQFESGTKPKAKDYVLIVGQMIVDEVVNHHALGGHAHHVWSLVEEVRRVSDKPIVVKLHPRQKVDWPEGNAKMREGIEKLDLGNIEIYDDYGSIHDFLPEASHMITASSGSGFEAMMHDVPLITFGHPEYHWETFDLRKRCEMRRALDTDTWYSKENTRKFLYWYMQEYCFFDFLSAKRRVNYLLSQKSYEKAHYGNKKYA